MKTIIMRDIIELVATEEQLDELATKLTESQFYDLMMNTGTAGDRNSIEVLSTKHPGSKEYKEALVKCVGKTKKFWENANVLVGKINQHIADNDRKKFHIIDRVIDPKLIGMLEKGVPSEDEALALVIEDTYEANNILSGFINGTYDESQMAKVKLTLEGKPVEAYVGTRYECFLGRYQPKNSLVIYLLKKFRDLDKKTVTITKREIMTYVERERYSGVLEMDLLRSAFYVVFNGKNGTRTMCYPCFCETSAERKEHTKERYYPTEFPEKIVVTVHESTWALLTNVACEYKEALLSIQRQLNTL